MKERERKSVQEKKKYIYKHTTHNIHICIYIEREKENERNIRKSERKEIERDIRIYTYINIYINI